MDKEYLRKVISHYFNELDYAIDSMQHGANNYSYRLIVKDKEYLLRVYGSPNAIDKLQYEHEVLQQLATQNLSFKIPAPIKTLNNEYYVIIDGKVSALFPFIVGQESTRTTTNYFELGEKVGELTCVLQSIKPVHTPSYVPTYQLLDIYPNIAKDCLDNFLNTSTLDHELCAFFLKEFNQIQREIVDLIERLPVQLIHGDLMLSNILMNDGQITGIVDFEFVSPDFRMSEVAITLSQFIRKEINNEQLLSIIKDFIKGYSTSVKVTKDEISALPILIKIRMSTLVLHFISRYFEGLNDLRVVEAQLERFAYVVHWINQNGEPLKRLFYNSN